ncbi:hypothetical protein CI109_101883 [Kwoniella shandongensis]|uniref:Uncharacterized protein n=1 Tax=Kwoniella shandongensis TaxID=1734106 RepID=A0A5M6BPQ7_9TREE|nr:uncharacterized protein CI109_006755 [Kwoniella shandongensis]KAA5524884.1 hypothetical protein CI109_006755 [Kwoniella shandongensis]
MKAFQVSEHAHPSKIKVSEIPSPKADPKKGQVLVDVYAAGLNFFDILQSQGKYQTQPPLPFVLGSELAGVISPDSELPEDCPYSPGDRVFGYAQGAYAEQVVADWRALIPVPEILSLEEAATVFLTITTSYAAIVDRAQAQEGEWVLVHAGAGGVGLAACQIAKEQGCKVIATASSEEKRKACIDYGGADEVVDYTKKDWQNEVKRITGGEGVNVVFDPVGMIIPSLKCVAWNARLVVVGFAAGSIEKIPANLLLLKQVAVTGIFWGGTQVKDPASVFRVTFAVLDLLSSGKVKPVLYDKMYKGLETVSEGLGDIEQRKVWGKAVVRIRDGAGSKGSDEDEKVRAKL